MPDELEIQSKLTDAVHDIQDVRQELDYLKAVDGQLTDAIMKIRSAQEALRELMEKKQ